MKRRKNVVDEMSTWDRARLAAGRCCGAVAGALGWGALEVDRADYRLGLYVAGVLGVGFGVLIGVKILFYFYVVENVGAEMPPPANSSIDFFIN
jgi:hypothetical protein